MTQPTRFPRNSQRIRYFALVLTFALFAASAMAQETDPDEAPLVFGIGQDYPPYSYFDEDGQFVGYNVDLTTAIAEIMHLNIEVRIGPWAEIREALEMGEVDAVAGMLYSKERDITFDFSAPYTIIHNAIFARHDAPAITTEVDLRGEDIIVSRGDIVHDYVLKNGISENPVLVPSQGDAMLILASGEHEYALVGHLTGLHFMKEFGLTNIQTVGPLLWPSNYGFAVVEGNATLQHLLSEGLAALGETGAHKRIYDRWLGVLITDDVSSGTVLKYITLVGLPLLMLLALTMFGLRTLKKQVIQRTRELSESEMRFRTICEFAPVLINAFDENGRCVIWNKHCRETFGWTIDEINAPGCGMALFYPDPDASEAVFRSIINDPDGQFREWHPLTKDGRTLTTMWANFRLAGGVMFSLGHDITEREQSEKERECLLHTADKRVKELHCMNGVLKSIRARETLEDVFDDVVALIPSGWHFPEIARGRICFDDQVYVSQPFEDTQWRLDAEIIVSGEARGTIEVFYIEAPSFGDCCTKLDNGVFVKEELDLVIVIARALSEAVEYHEAEAGRERIENQLRESQKMEAVGQLAGGIAHDFNNLLQVINGYSDMMLTNHELETRSRVALQEIADAGEKAAVLVRHILAYSSRQVLDMSDVNLSDVISNLMKMIRRIIGEHISLDFRVGHDLGTVRADSGQIEQIVMNLCVNARDAMPEGGTITIETENVHIDQDFCRTHSWAEPGSYVLLSVSDTGCGMDAETLSCIFEPFFTTKEVGEGSGLGLSMVYGLIKQHNGLLHVYSEVGKGSIFRIYLPLIEKMDTDVEDIPEKPAVGGTEMILLADDDEGVLGVAKAFLENAGYTVLTAADGEEALGVFGEYDDKINLVLLDVMMPKIGGKAVYERIREGREDLKFLFASGYNMDSIHTNFVVDKGMNLIQKPYHRNDLLRAVRAALDAESDGSK